MARHRCVDPIWSVGMDLLREGVYVTARCLTCGWMEKLEKRRPWFQRFRSWLRRTYGI